MPELRIHLFGRFSVRSMDGVVAGLDGARVQELFSFLLLARRSHPREALADALWGPRAGLQARKSLRQALWQLQTALEKILGCADSILVVDADWVGINAAADVWLDLEVFQQASRSAQGISGSALDSDQAHTLDTAVELYGNGLLAGCYQEWCLCERERLEQLYIGMLDKLMLYDQVHEEYEAGLEYGERILRLDRARERTHRRMMRLYYFAGDRTRALRQYARCVAALAQELDVAPSLQTRRLYDDLRLERLVEPPDRAPQMPAPDLLSHVREAGKGLVQAQHLLEQQQHRMRLLEQHLREG
jgi:DNA-binding SARP family transcriptional activator